MGGDAPRGAMTKSGRKASTLQARRRHVRWGWGVAGAALLLAVTLGVVLLRPGPAPTVGDAADPALGRADAPVTLYYFADFQCPYCREFELRVLPSIERNYVEPGLMRLVFKDFPILGGDSWTAAAASQHVWTNDPEEYWAWHRGMFEMQGAERSGWASAENVLAYSARFDGVDEAALRADLDNLDEAQADKREGEGAGIRSTPTLLLDGVILRALDEPAVRDALDAKLAER